MSAARQSPLVIGLGSTDRGDDAVGAEVARLVGDRVAGVAVLDHEDPTALLDLWAGHSPVVVVDAVCSGATPGTVHRLETGQDRAPVTSQAWARSGHGSTHALGLGEMVEIGRALGRLPERLVVIGIEAERFDHGAALSTRVAAAVPAAADQVTSALGSTPPIATAVAAQTHGEEVGDVPR